jgi:hypothetical protein
MKLNMRLCFGSASLAGILLFPGFSRAQQKQMPAAQASISYDLSRETVLEGTVVSFTSNSKIPPLGSHVTIQAAAGPVDVHLGSEAVLKSNDIFLAAGDSIRMVGENQPYGGGSFFAARVLQKGSQSVTLRNSSGIPLSPKRKVGGSTIRSHRVGAL